MNTKIIGRHQEQKILETAYQSNKAEFIAIYGRRRVGKTFLIKTFFDSKSSPFFYCSGLQDGKLNAQLKEFANQLGHCFYQGAPIAPAKTWMDALAELHRALSHAKTMLKKGQKITLFFDELPWLASRRSGALEALDYYWNRYWSHESHIKLIVCGSAASWMIDKIINNKGGLHNRVTRTIQLEPFSLAETQVYLDHNGVKLNQTQILELYMALGGIPHYLSLMFKGKSSSQIIDELCFQKAGALVSEFDRLFSSLFTDGTAYALLIEQIAKHRYGIGQAALIKATKLPDGGSTKNKLMALEQAGFIQAFIPHQHQDKGIYYKVIDEYCLFYLHWIKPHLNTIQKQSRIKGYWLAKQKEAAWKSWSGYAFEAICYKHISEIKTALHIAAGAEIGSWRYVPRLSSQTGCQIDLLFDRADGVITLCEIKYNAQPFIIDKAYAKSLQNKLETYRKMTRTKKQLFLGMVTANGLKETMYSEEIVHAVITLDDLFK